MGRGYRCRGCNIVKLSYWFGKCDNCLRLYDPVPTNIDDPGAEVAPLVDGEVMPLCDVKIALIERYSTNFPGVDKVLGGGIVPGSIIMIAGSPGGGKSTILLQIAQQLAKQRIQVLYFAGEESIEQIKARADRIGEFRAALQIVRVTDLDDILNLVDEHRPKVFIVDSAQTVEVEDYLTGSARAIKIAGDQINSICKTSEFAPACFIVAQVTKDEGFAGPNALMHAIDTSLFIEGSNKNKHRKLKCENKNRWGSTPQVAHLLMTDKGLVEINNPDPDDEEETFSETTKALIIPKVEEEDGIYKKPGKDSKPKVVIEKLTRKKTNKKPDVLKETKENTTKPYTSLPETLPPPATPMIIPLAITEPITTTAVAAAFVSNSVGSRTKTIKLSKKVDKEPVPSYALPSKTPRLPLRAPEGLTITAILTETCNVPDCKGSIGRACTSSSGVRDAGFHESRVEKAKEAKKGDVVRSTSVYSTDLDSDTIPDLDNKTVDMFKAKSDKAKSDTVSKPLTAKPRIKEAKNVKETKKKPVKVPKSKKIVPNLVPNLVPET